MDTNLITYDMDNFLKKYTRFMTKDIYISNSLYDKFLKQYDYLYQEIDKNSLLFSENIKYKKVMNIKQNKINLLKLHNKKYLKKAIDKYEGYFSSLNYNKMLDNNKKAIILSDEDNLIVINDKKNIELIISKIKYLIEFLKLKEEDILILTNNVDDTLLSELDNNYLKQVNYKEFSCFKNKILEKNKLVTKGEVNSILLEYITNELFENKDEFQKIYKAFSNNIYLNKDYKDFDTFKDYHNYIYKKIYLTSNLSLAKFNEKEIEKRKDYLRTIDNIVMNNKEDVDIANFLYLNSIDYIYKKNAFIISLNDKKTYISFKNTDIGEDFIHLKSDEILFNNYIEKLIYELIKRRYPLEYITDEDIYNKLKDTSIYNYFNEFLNKVLIPLIDDYDKNKNFTNIILDDDKKEVIINVYNYYKKYLKDNNLITKNDFNYLLGEYINNYKFVIINGDIDVNLTTKNLKIIEDYNDIFFKENIKLLYDYKKYLIDNSKLPIKNVFLNKEEITNLTNNFIKENIDKIINSESENKKINIYLYEDSNRLTVNKNISKLSKEILNGKKKKLIGLESINQINNLILKNYFSKYDKFSLIDSTNNIIPFEEINNISIYYDNILLPFVIKDLFSKNNILNNNDNFKIIFYKALSKCKDNLMILCPISKKNDIKRMLKDIKNIKFEAKF